VHSDDALTKNRTSVEWQHVKACFLALRMCTKAAARAPARRDISRDIINSLTMSARVSNLLDRYRSVALANALLFDNLPMDIECTLRAINLRQLLEAAEVAQVIYHEIQSKDDEAAPKRSTVRNEINSLTGVSYWTRRLLMQAAQETDSSNLDPIRKAFEDLMAAMDFTKRKVRKVRAGERFEDRNGEVARRIRELPTAIRNVYETVSWKH